MNRKLFRSFIGIFALVLLNISLASCTTVSKDFFKNSQVSLDAEQAIVYSGSSQEYEGSEATKKNQKANLNKDSSMYDTTSSNKVATNISSPTNINEPLAINSKDLELDEPQVTDVINLFQSNYVSQEKDELYLPWSQDIIDFRYYDQNEVDKSNFSDIWDELRSSMTWKVPTERKEVKVFLNRYRYNQQYFDEVVERARPYLFYIMQVLKQNDIPMEIALLPIVESNYDPYALSFANASGMWQFTSGTAAVMLIDRDWWFDGRRDVIISTNKAIEYLQRLERYLGDWALAISSYNAGPGRVKSALRYNRKRGRPTDFWSLRKLPKETRYYYPKLLALVEVIRNPDKYGIMLNPIPNKPYFKAYHYSPQIELKELANAINTPAQDIMLLNPGYNQWLTRSKGNRFLLVPFDKAKQTVTYLKSRENITTAWERYYVNNKTSAENIAAEFNTSVDKLMEVNSREYLNNKEGRVVFVPIEYHRIDFYQNKLNSQLTGIASKNIAQAKTHIVKKGDSLWTIARQYNITISKLMKWNNLRNRGAILRPKKALLLYQPQEVKNFPLNSKHSLSVWRDVPIPIRKKTNTLNKIADKFGLSTANLIDWNISMPRRTLSSGRVYRFQIDVTEVMR